MQSSSTSSDEVLTWYRNEVERLVKMLETEQHDRDQASQAVLVRATARPRTPLTRFALCTLSLHTILSCDIFLSAGGTRTGADAGTGDSIENS
jgi:hypothetical protein